jgi:hypothetical protein
VDRLTARAGGETAVLDPARNDSGGLGYVGEVGADATEVAVVLERVDGDQASTVVVPHGFQVLTPASGQAVAAGEAFHVTTDLDVTSVVVEGPCVKRQVITTLLFASADFPVGPLEAEHGHGGETCDVTVRVINSRPGTPAPGFDPETSFVEAYQVREVTILVTVLAG